MPSMAVHLAVANEFLKNNPLKDKKEFRDGVLRPDLLGMISQEEKVKSHFGCFVDEHSSVLEKFSSKVDLLKYLNLRKVDSDFERGYYLHLVTDYYWFNHFLYKPEFEDDSFDKNNIYDDYEKIAKDMEERFGVDNSDTPWAGLYQQGEPKMFSRQNLYGFIEKCSKLDIFLLCEKILKNPENWRQIASKFFE